MGNLCGVPAESERPLRRKSGGRSDQVELTKARAESVVPELGMTERPRVHRARPELKVRESMQWGVQQRSTPLKECSDEVRLPACMPHVSACIPLACAPPHAAVRTCSRCVPFAVARVLCLEPSRSGECDGAEPRARLLTTAGGDRGVAGAVRTQMLLAELEHRNIRLHEKVTESMVQSRYKFGRPLGQGSSAMVYEGKNKRTGMEVAIKVIKKNDDMNDDESMATELDILKTVHHRHGPRSPPPHHTGPFAPPPWAFPATLPPL